MTQLIEHSLLAVLGLINWPFFLLLFFFVYTFAVSLSTWSVLFEEITFHKYERRRDVLRLLAVGLLEPFFYPVHTVFAVIGNIQFLTGKKGWGGADRRGFEMKDNKRRKLKGRKKIQ
ncbi:MAG: hypothetical protein K9J25_13670 [Bacteroidales bacterium]|nr:hypothetical protein [Bacteroidales bacterium]